MVSVQLGRTKFEPNYMIDFGIYLRISKVHLAKLEPSEPQGAIL